MNTLDSESLLEQRLNTAAIGDVGSTRVPGAASAAGLPTRRAAPLDPVAARVCVVMPVRNEEGHISAALESVLAQTFDPRRLEIVVVDGISDDGTVAIAQGMLRGRANARVLKNDAKTTSSGLNAGIRNTQADVIVRVDGHCRLAPNYLERCVDLLCETGAGNAGGLMRPRGEGAIGRAMALALRSRFGIGDSRFHYLERREFVDSVYLGAFRRVVLEKVGLYDESLLANEDFELNYRIREAGYGVLLSPDIRSTYIPRGSLVTIATQFFRYGQWKARVMRKHPRSVQPRHLAAPALVAAMCLTIPAFVFTRRRSLMLPIRLYMLANLVAALSTARPRRFAPALFLVFPAIHLSWGSGVLVGLLRSMPLTANSGGSPMPAQGNRMHESEASL